MNKEAGKSEADIMMNTNIEYNKHDVFADLESSLKEVKLMRVEKRQREVGLILKNV